MVRRAVFVVALVATLVFANCSAPPAHSAKEPHRGAVLYERHCASCHGPDGDGSTAIAALLRPRPEPFWRASFALVSTDNGVASDDDLVRTLRRGMPGSVMMSWNWLPEADLVELAREVRRLAIAGRARWLQRTSEVGGRTTSLAAATAIAERDLQPGATVDVGVPAEPDAATLATGRTLFVQHCAACHGAAGKGLAAVRSWTDHESMWPRDLTAGYLRGGDSFAALAHRIRSGMPGARMPPTPMPPHDAAMLVAYLQSLLPDGAADRHVQVRRTIRVSRLPRLPAAGDRDAVAALPAVRLPLAPLWWRSEAVDEAWLRAARDGDDLLLQLAWNDPTRNDRASPDGSYGDGVAVQWTRVVDAPLVGMGSPEHPVNVWRWRAYDPKETAGMLDLAESRPHAGLDVPIADWRPKPRSEALQLSGIPTVAGQTGAGEPLAVQTEWRDGRWSVTFRRPLRARSDREVDFVAPGPVLFALAVWDGHVDAHPGSKAITTWHVLELEP